MSMNVGEYGLALNINTNFVLTGFTSLTLDFTRPDGTTFTRTGGLVTAPAVDYVTTDGNGTFLANKYAKYTIAVGDLTVPGPYSVRLSRLDASPMLLKSDPASFTVNE